MNFAWLRAPFVAHVLPLLVRAGPTPHTNLNAAEYSPARGDRPRFEDPRFEGHSWDDR
ncbi:MAG: hypothetical protein AVDCRST_MAG05-2621 [uncultured Rubrobacteraceae bacterium]|uniref:Uncharacterized protein n=1 Tax=uncultured Rubrobacteraceae bacterium TaxID=349277 RepID=A0A6J4SSH2_9ACTN|nr:MAG: hypothetical protein AVDCRST_MAG05-2621 [uncultured Rubrobacteraceae bacterium]